MIFVTVGTHGDPFDRLMVAMDRWAGAHDEEVVVQSGVSLGGRHCTVSPWMSEVVVRSHMERARLVVCHAGPATLFEAWDRGHRPIVVPRDPDHGEHVDDHQIRFAARLGDRATVLGEPALLDEMLATALAFGANPNRIESSNTSVNPVFLDGFESLVESLVGNSGHGGGVDVLGWCTLGAVVQWIRATVTR